jgi:hypothetical protein
MEENNAEENHENFRRLSQEQLRIAVSRSRKCGSLGNMIQREVPQKMKEALEEMMMKVE